MKSSGTYLHVLALSLVGVGVVAENGSASTMTACPAGLSRKEAVEMKARVLRAHWLAESHRATLFSAGGFGTQITAGTTDVTKPWMPLNSGQANPVGVQFNWFEDPNCPENPDTCEIWIQYDDSSSVLAWRSSYYCPTYVHFIWYDQAAYNACFADQQGCWQNQTHYGGC